MQLDPQLAGLCIVPLQLSLHQHQPLLKLIERDPRRFLVRPGDQGFEIVSLKGNSGHSVVVLKTSPHGANEFKVGREQIANVVNPQRHHRHTIEAKAPGNDRHRDTERGRHFRPE